MNSDAVVIRIDQPIHAERRFWTFSVYDLDYDQVNQLAIEIRKLIDRFGRGLDQ